MKAGPPRSRALQRALFRFGTAILSPVADEPRPGRDRYLHHHRHRVDLKVRRDGTWHVVPVCAGSEDAMVEWLNHAADVARMLSVLADRDPASLLERARDVFGERLER